ncbi:hypothetical protein Q8F55_000870 [Vanrija albida]|uniref:Helicase C-terminal domain-containing protein n=1 Tax=Vanrija albida TaxID=181172 RepID=A0ABR3QEI8_9TREE
MYHIALLYPDSGRGDTVRSQQISKRVFEFCLLETLLKQWRQSEEENNKVLIFSNSVRLLKMIKEFIDISDDFDKTDRMAMVDKFQDPNEDMFVMLVSTLAGGANKVVIFDPSWNPANDLQAMDRAFRIGQKRPV